MTSNLISKKTQSRREKVVAGLEAIHRRTSAEVEHEDDSRLDHAAAATRRDSSTRIIPVDLIDIPPQLRRVDEHSPDFVDLVDSIREHGLLQPISDVRPVPDSHRFQLIAGEHRLRAILSLGLNDIQATIREADDQEVHVQRIVENVQRVDLNPVDEALGYLRLRDEFGLSQREIVQETGKKEDYVSKYISIPTRLDPDEVTRLRKLAPGQVPGKTLILLALRDGISKSDRDTILFGGITRKEAESLVGPGKTKPGRKKHASHKCKPVAVADKKIAVTLMSSTSEPLTTAEVAHALELTIQEETEGAMDALPPVGGFKH